MNSEENSNLSRLSSDKCSLDTRKFGGTNEKAKRIEIGIGIEFSFSCRLFAVRMRSTETIQIFVHALRCTCSDLKFPSNLRTIRLIFK